MNYWSKENFKKNGTTPNAFRNLLIEILSASGIALLIYITMDVFSFINEGSIFYKGILGGATVILLLFIKDFLTIILNLFFKGELINLVKNLIPKKNKTL